MPNEQKRSSSSSYLLPALIVSALLALGAWQLLPRAPAAGRQAGPHAAEVDAGGAASLRSGGGSGSGGGSEDVWVADEEDVRGRAGAAVLGALVADAATMGLHWIYDLDTIKDLVAQHGRKEEPAFFDPPSCPYYEYESGALSPYGDELLPVLQYMTLHQEGTMDGPGFAEFLAHYYKNYTGRLNKSSRAMMEALLQGGRGWPQCGDPRDTQANNFVKVIPVVARYAGQPGLAAAVNAAVRAQQNNDEAVALGMAAALLLERVILGHSIASAVEWAADGAPGSAMPLSKSALAALRSVVEQRNSGTALRDLLYTPGSDTKAGEWGPSCANPGALKGALLGALQAASAASSTKLGSGDDSAYARGVRSNMLLGGDNCSRGLLLGALLAAEGGPAAIPSAWRSQTRAYGSCEVLVAQLLDFRSSERR